MGHFNTINIVQKILPKKNLVKSFVLTRFYTTIIYGSIGLSGSRGGSPEGVS